jgi:insulysin
LLFIFSLLKFIYLLFIPFYQEMVTKEYQNFKYQQPYQQAMYYCSLILQDQTWPWVEQLEVLPVLQAEDLAKFVPVMLSRTFLECYIAGF